MMTQKQTKTFVRKLGPERADRLLTVLEKIAALPADKRAIILETALDIMDPQAEPRPHADPIKVAEGRALLAGA